MPPLPAALVVSVSFRPVLDSRQSRWEMGCATPPIPILTSSSRAAARLRVGLAQSQGVEEEVGGSRVLEDALMGGCGCVPVEGGGGVSPGGFHAHLPLAEKLYGSSGPELRRSLFSLKQIFQVRPRGGLGVSIQAEPPPTKLPHGARRRTKTWCLNSCTQRG